jgi:hypothetical protein
MPKGIQSRISRLARVAPGEAIEQVLDAYERAGGFPDGAARLLGYRTRRGRDALHRLNRRLGIVHMIRARTGHHPGWMGPQVIVLRAHDPQTGRFLPDSMRSA